jgi:hypothetical protein
LGAFSKNNRIAFKFNSSLFFYLTNLGRFGVWFLSTGGSYLPAFTVVLNSLTTNVVRTGTKNSRPVGFRR